MRISRGKTQLLKFDVKLIGFHLVEQICTRFRPHIKNSVEFSENETRIETENDEEDRIR